MMLKHAQRTNEWAAIEATALVTNWRTLHERNGNANAIAVISLSRNEAMNITSKAPFEVVVRRVIILMAVAFLVQLPALASYGPKHQRLHTGDFIATAYSVEGIGASGKWSHPGSVAADPNMLPLNTRIRIYGAGRYSGDYMVEDTGSKVKGKHLDVYMRTQAEAKKFGRQRIRVIILHDGDDQPQPPDPHQIAAARAIDRAARAKSRP